MAHQDDPAFDWRNKDHLNSIKDQGPEGNCCFAFVVCGVIEALHHIKHGGRHINLSAQDLYNHLIRDTKQDKAGRTIPETLNWIRENGCVLEETCPYEGTFKPIGYERKVYLWIETYLTIDLTKDLIFNDKHKAEERKLENELKKGPVAAEILWTEELGCFEGGVIYSGPKNVKALDKAAKHAVMIVDFGEEMVNKKLVKYWVIRNSHGDDWADEGYAKINRAPSHGRLLVHTAWVIRGIRLAN